MSYDIEAKAKALRARINVEKPSAPTLEIILAEALKEAFLAGAPSGKLNPKQEERAVDILTYAADGCGFVSLRDFKPGLTCAQDSGKGFNCTACEARMLLQELGYVQNERGIMVKRA